MNGLSKLVILGMTSLLPWQALAVEPPKPDAKPGMEALKPGMMGGKAYWEKVDGNHDGNIDKKEWMASSADRFKEFDANGDGNISKDELKAHREKMRAHYEGLREQRHGMTPPLPPASVPSLAPSAPAPEKN